MSDEKPSGSSNEPQPATSAAAEALAAANEINAPGSLPSVAQRNPNHGPQGKFVVGNRAASKGDLHSGRAGDAAADAEGEAESTAERRLAVLRRLFDAISREAHRYADAGRTHRLGARDQQQLLNMVERLGTIDGRIRELEASATSGQSATDGEEAPADWPQRLALVFANQPDLFAEFLTSLLSADRDRTGPLRQQARLVLDAFAQKGVPKFRGKRPDDDPEVMLL